MSFLVNRRVFISMLFIGLSMLGYISYKNLPLELFPNAEEPIFYVQVFSASEVSPEYMEQQAIIPLEGAAGTLEGVEQIESQATSNRGTITLNYNRNTNIKFAYLKLLEKVEQVKTTLPEEFNVNVVKSDTEILNNLFMSLQVLGEGGVDRMRDITDKEIKPELENIDGVASAQIFGGREKTVEIILDSDICEAYDITPNYVRAVLNQNFSDKAYVGEVYEGNTRQFVHVTAEYNSIRDIEELVVRSAGPILLGDIADVYFGVKEQTTLSRTNGLESVSIQLVRDSQVNMIDLSHTTQEVIDRLNKSLASQNAEVRILFNTAQIMEDNIDQIMELAIIGGLLAVFILWIFLRNLKLVIAIGLSIPISVFTAFNFFYAAGISINSLTLIGMALAIGMLVDNSVVVLENIYRHASMGKSRREAVIQGTSEIRRSVFAATLTTVTIFVPFLFASEVFVKLIGTHIGVSIISTLVVSLFVSLLLIPMLTYVFMGSERPEAFQRVSIHNKLIRAYVVLLKASMRKPARTVLTAIGVFFAVVLLSLLVSTNTDQEVETNDLNVQVTMEGGSTLEMADNFVSEIEDKIGQITEVEDVVSSINEEDATLQVKLKEDYKEIGNRSAAEIRSDILNRTENINVSSIDVNSAASGGIFGGGGGSRGGGGGRRGASGFMSFLGIGTQEEILIVKGQDFEQMRKVAEDLEYYLDNLSSVQSVNLNIDDNRPEVRIEFDQRLMSQYGLTMNEVTNELSGFQPEFSSGVTFKDGIETYDVTIKTDEPEEDVSRTMNDLRVLEVESPSGSLHEMQEIGDLYYATGMWGINRVNQEKEIEVVYSFYSEYNQNNDLLTAAKSEVGQMISGIVLPAGVAVEMLETEDEFAEYKFLIAAAAILIFMILASIFESAITPFVLMFSIPLAAIGSLTGLVLTGNSILNPNSLTGLLILLGVVVNNSIILIDYSNILRRRGYNRIRALVTAGIGRVRPILITAITTIVAMIPLAMGQMEYVALIGAPFAITVIGGLALSTVLTLIFIPTLNLGLENSIRWIRDRDWRIQVVMGVFYLFGIYLIWSYIESDIWKAIWLVLLTVGIPGITYFLIRSLAQASEEIIPRNEEIIIRIENLVKIYGRPNKLNRDWKSGELRSEKSGEKKLFRVLKDFSMLIWLIPLLGFLGYLTYWYLGANFWQLFFGVVTYLVLLSTLDVLGKLSRMLFETRILKVTGSFFNRVFYWGFPAAHLAFLYIEWNSIALVVFFAIIWYLSIFIYRSARKLKGSDVKPEAMKGRLRRFYYDLVYKMPVIGKKQEPFKALKGVSLEIGNGMFGLLGPNGAGKTTLMRTVCGIFEQSYGKIWFNEFDSQEKREELQGLIGYLPQEFGMYENMTPWEYLNYQSILKGILNKKIREERLKMVLESVNMFESRNDKIGSFSGGMKQRIGIAQILLHLPRILVVDEPTAGLDPRERIRFRNLLVELSRDRIVIFSTHIIEDIASSCKDVAVLNKGELKYVGTPSEMAKIAEGKVWQFNVNQKEFEKISATMRVVHHMQQGDTVRVRCLSEKQPFPDAIEVRPNLEDSYLWLMKDTGKVMSQLE